jgi:hypothetical protein
MNKQKDDNGKLRWDLLPLDVVEKVVEIYEFGANKYEENSWRTIENGYKRCRAALFRHLTAYDKGERVDPESGKSHLAHAAWNALSMVYFAEREQDEIEEWLSAKPSDKPYGHIKIEPIQPHIEFQFHEGEFVTPKEAPGRGYEILSRKYIVNDKVAYFCKHLGWLTESELLRYDPSEECDKENCQ